MALGAPLGGIGGRRVGAAPAQARARRSAAALDGHDVVEVQPDAGAAVRALAVERRDDERQRVDEVRRQRDHELALEQRLADEAEVEVLQVAQAAVDELGRAARRAGGVVGALDERDAVAARGGVERDAGARDAAADDDEVERLGGERFERVGAGDHRAPVWQAARTRPSSRSARSLPIQEAEAHGRSTGSSEDDVPAPGATSARPNRHRASRGPGPFCSRRIGADRPRRGPPSSRRRSWRRPWPTTGSNFVEPRKARPVIANLTARARRTQALRRPARLAQADAVAPGRRRQPSRPRGHDHAVARAAAPARSRRCRVAGASRGAVSPDAAGRSEWSSRDHARRARGTSGAIPDTDIADSRSSASIADRRRDRRRGCLARASRPRLVVVT